MIACKILSMWMCSADVQHLPAHVLTWCSADVQAVFGWCARYPLATVPEPRSTAALARSPRQTNTPSFRSTLDVPARSLTYLGHARAACVGRTPGERLEHPGPRVLEQHGHAGACK